MAQRIVIRGGQVWRGGRGAGVGLADVLVDGSRIEAVGRDLPIDDASVVDASGCVIVPGLVDAYRLAWASLTSPSRPMPSAAGMCRLRHLVAATASPVEVYATTYADHLDALAHGITTVVAVTDVVTTPEHIEAALEAMQRSRIRGVFAMSTQEPDSASHAGSAPHAHGRQVRRIRAERLSTDDGRVRLGLAAAQLEAATMDELHADLELGRELGIGHISTNVGRSGTRIPRPLLDPSLAIARAERLPAGEVVRTLAAGSALTLTPAVREPLARPARLAAHHLGAVGFGSGLGSGTHPFDVNRRLAAALRLGVADGFPSGASARAAEGPGARTAGASPNEQDLESYGAAAALHVATLGGAAAAGLDHLTGTLRPGRAADLLVVRLRRDDGPVARNDAAALSRRLVRLAEPSDIELVMVGGEVVRHRGEAVGADGAAARRQLDVVRHRLAARGHGR